jgi:Fic family protein
MMPPFSIDEINGMDMSDFGFSADERLYLFLAKKDKVDFVYNTAALEGNPLTYPEVETLLEGITVGGRKLSDELQILNQNRSVNLLFSMLEQKTFAVDKKTLCLLHAEVSRDEALQWGVFRNGNVNIGGTDYLPPSPDKLDVIFEEGRNGLGQIIHPLLRALTYFLFGARTQFFYDGNKRVSRLMMNGILLSAGYPALNIKVKDKLEFNQQMIAFYDTGDYQPTLTYLYRYYCEKNAHIAKMAT